MSSKEGSLCERTLRYRRPSLSWGLATGNHRISYLRPFGGNRTVCEVLAALCETVPPVAPVPEAEIEPVYFPPQVGDQHHSALTATLPRKIRSISDQDRGRDRGRDLDQDQDQR